MPKGHQSLCSHNHRGRLDGFQFRNSSFLVCSVFITASSNKILGNPFTCSELPCWQTFPKQAQPIYNPRPNQSISSKEEETLLPCLNLQLQSRRRLSWQYDWKPSTCFGFLLLKRCLTHLLKNSLFISTLNSSLFSYEQLIFWCSMISIWKETLYVWNEPKHCIRGVPLPEKRTSPCETVDFWLKVGAGVGAFTAVLLIALTCYFWKKNQK